jgi:DNA-cytosine methyltransferase
MKVDCRDIHEVQPDEIPDFDVMLAGFPCQAFSIAGNREGFEDQKGRGTLFFELVRLFKAKKPSIIFLENVKNLVGHDNGNTFCVIVNELEKEGYHVKYRVLNAMEYGNIPQNRERIYIVAFKDIEAYRNFEFPMPLPLNKSIKDIIEFADLLDIEDVKETLDRQIEYNMNIANEGLNNKYGANIGKTILKYGGNDIVQYCKALAASGSDARMNGCEMPVVINSGSGNQGITASVPVIAYHSRLNLDKDVLYRALVVSNLCTIHIKNNIGKLSAYCGVVIAGAGCGAGICYLEGGRLNEIAHTLVNALAIISGVVCDGAKSSCAAKIASSVEAGIFGYYMFKEGNEFVGGEGIVKKGVENTIKAVGDLARVGMCETDKEIIYIMTH